MLILIVLVSSFFYTTIECAASSSAMPSIQTGTAERGFIRSQDGSIRVVTYDPNDKDAVASLIDANIHEQPYPLSGSAQAHLKMICRTPLQEHPTIELLLTDVRVDIFKQPDGRDPLKIIQRFYGGQPEQIDLNIPGKLLQTIYDHDSAFLSRLDNGAYFRHGPGYNWQIIVDQPLPLEPTDCALMSGGYDWLVTLEGARLINLYYYSLYRESVEYDSMDGSDNWIEVTPHTLERDKDTNLITYATCNLFTKAQDDPEPVICSFAFSNTRKNRKLALIFPDRVMIWHLHACGYPKEVKAKGKVIAQADLAADKLLEQLSSFNAGVFSRHVSDQDFLYIVGNNYIWRYGCKDDTIERFRFTSVPGLSGTRSIATSQDGERLAVADPRAGVVVFDTKTMALLCSLQSSLCKHIALHHHKLNDLVAISEKLDDGRTQESVWKLVPRKKHISLQQCCFNLLGLPQ